MMADRAAAYSQAPVVDVEALLSQILDELTAWVRVNYFQEGYDSNFDDDLVRYRNDARRQLRLARGAPIVRGTMNVHVAGNQGHVNVAGLGSVAHQTISGASLSEVSRLLAAINNAIADARVADDVRLELRDYADALEQEAVKPMPDQGKLKRAGKRLIDFAEKVAVGAVAAYVAALIKLHVGS